MGGVCAGSKDATDKQLQNSIDQTKKKERKVKKLLLLGAGGSGKSTFFKQLKLIHGTGINSNEMDTVYKDIVFSNIITGMLGLVNSADELDQHNSEFPGWDHEKHFAEFDHDEQYCPPDLLPEDKMTESNAAAWIRSFDEDNFLQQRQNIKGIIHLLWSSGRIQATWEKRSKFQIQDSASHFFDRIDNITAPNYEPTTDDCLLARIRTTGIVEQAFSVKGNQFQVFDVGGQRNERKKWIHCFEHVTGVIFLASLSAYDQTLYEDDQTNRMKEALDLFKQICNSRWFKETAMILFLNKKDLFKSKIQGTPLSVCFPDCGKGVEHDELEAREYIKKQFVKLNHPIKAPNGKSKKKPLFCHYTCAIDRNQVEKIFRDVQNVIIHANLEKAALI